MSGGLLRRLLLVAVAAALAAPASAQPTDGSVLLFAAEGSDPALLSAVDERLRVEVEDLLGPRLAQAKAARPGDCDVEPECYVDLAVEQRATRLVLVRLEGSGGRTHLTARLLDDGGRLVAAAERDVEGTPGQKLLRGVAVQLLTPSRYTGTLRLTDVAPGTQVSVDRLPLRQRDLTEPVALTVGVHDVQVAEPGAPVRQLRVQVPFEDEVTLSAQDAPAPPSEIAPAVGFPIWPAAVTGAVAGVALVAAGGYLVDSAFTSAWTTAEARALPTVKSAGANPHFFAARFIPSQGARLADARLAVHNSLRVSAVAAALAVTSGAVAGALAAAYLAPGGEPAAGE